MERTPAANLPALALSVLLTFASSSVALADDAALPRFESLADAGKEAAKKGQTRKHSGAAKKANLWTASSVHRNEFELRNGIQKIRVGLLAPGVVRVRLVQDGAIFNESPSYVTLPGAFSNNAVQEKAAVTSELPNGVRISHPEMKLSVRVEMTPLRVIFEDEKGGVISEDLLGRSPQLDKNGFQVWKSSPIDEHYFGLGDKMGGLDRRDHSFTCWNTDAFLFQESSDPIYKSVPFFLALRNGNAYGIYLNNTYRSFFDFNKTVRSAYTFGAEGGELDYYFFYGPNPKTVITSFTDLVGRMPLPPLFSLGYQQSRGSYFPEDRVMNVARELRQRRIPADVIYFDGDYKQDAHPFTVNKKYFPDFGRVIGNLSKMGFKSIISMDPYLAKAPGEAPYEQGIASGYFVTQPDGKNFVGQVWPGEVVFPDFTRAEVRKWWGGLHEYFMKIGVRGIWDDMNEPALFKSPEKTIPLDVVHSCEGRKTDHREVHNIYGMQNTRATFEGLAQFRANQRPFILTRSGFAGSQRYAATWTGDNTSSWNHMRISVPQLLNLGVSGYTFAGSDIGGFNGFTGGPTPDLLTRWMQLGAFNPLFRNHSDGVTRDREPWVDGPEHEAIRKKFIEERYKLLPYIYNCMEEASRTGIPLMRPMFLEYPQDASLVSNADQYMFGPSLLVAPRLWDIPGSYGVQLPEDIWYDYWTGKRMTGDKSLSVDPAINTFPIYARGGSVLPMQSVVQHVGEIPSGPLSLRVYFAPKAGESKVYFDDGDSYDYKNGKYMNLLVKYDFGQKEKFALELASSGDYLPPQKELQVTLFGINKKISKVLCDGVVLNDWKYSADSETLELPALAWLPNKSHKIEIE